MKFFFLFIVLSFVFLSCNKEKTVWDSNWKAPLVNDTITLDKFVNDSTLVESLGYYELDLHRTILDINLTELIDLNDTTITKNFSISFSSLLATPGTSFVNSIEEHDMNVKDVELKKLRLSKGIIHIRLENPLSTKVIFTLKLPGVTKNSIVFEQEFTAPSGTNTNPGIVEGDIDVAGFTMDLTGASGSTFNILQSQFTVKTDPNGPTVTVTNNDVTKILATLKDFKADYARGYFGNEVISDTTEVNIAQFSGISGLIDLPACNLNFVVSNGFKIPAKATLHMIRNENDLTGNSVELQTNPSNSVQIGQGFYLDGATGSWSTLQSAVKTLNFSSSNSNVEQYFENIGSKQKIGYSLQLNPWGNTSGGWNEIFPDSRLKVSIDASMPLQIGLDGLTIRDTFDLNIKQNTEKTHVVEGELILKATNLFPMSGALSLHLLDESGDVIHTVAGSSELKSSLFGSTYTNGIQTCISEVHFVLPKAVLSQLESVKKVAIQSEFNTPIPTVNGNSSLPIPVGAFLGVKLRGAFKLENRF